MRKIEYTLNEVEEKRFREWYAAQNAKAAQDQIDSGYLKDRPELEASVREQQKPYPGCTSAGPIWILSECGIGVAITVEHWYTHEQLDITDYDCW